MRNGDITSSSRDHVQASRETTLPLDGGDIHMTRDGACDAPALLLIHGSGSATHSWDALVPLLTDSHHIIRIDLLGHGRSAKPADGDYQIRTQARRLGAALDQIGVTHAVVVGHSSGGYCATALAEQRPDLVSALVLINTGPRPDAFIAQEGVIERSHWTQLTDEQIRLALSTAFSRTGYEIPSQLVLDVRAMTYHSFTATQQAARDYLEQQSLPERLKVLGKPLLVIFGEDDRRWRSTSAGYYRSVTGAQVEMLPGLGHSPILEDPPRTAGILLAFTANRATSNPQADGPA